MTTIENHKTLALGSSSTGQQQSFFERYFPLLCGCCQQNKGENKVYKPEVEGDHGAKFNWEQYRDDKAQKLDELMDERREEELIDFEETEDQIDAYSEAQIQKMSRWDKFEKQFPFYRIDVNGFNHLLQRAMRLTFEHEPNMPINEIEQVTLAAMQEAFKNNQTWSEALVSDPPTKLVQFLNLTCVGECADIPATETIYNVNKLRCLALIWCEDEPNEKVSEFWCILQDADQPTIAAHDKDFNKNMHILFDFSSEIVLKHEEEFLGQYGSPITEEFLQERRDTYWDVCEQFLDDIFGYEDQLSKADWQEKVLESAPWVFRSQTIRDKLGYPSD